MFFGLFMAMLYLSTGRISWLVVAGVGMAVVAIPGTTMVRMHARICMRGYALIRRFIRRLPVVRVRFCRRRFWSGLRRSFGSRGWGQGRTNLVQVR